MMFDKSIINELPYPIAFRIHYMENAESEPSRAKLGSTAFDILIRFVAYTTITQYIALPTNVLNEKQLNNQLIGLLKSPTMNDLINILKLTVETFKKKDLARRLLLHELTDLDESAWQKLLDSASIMTDVKSSDDKNNAEIAPKVVKAVYETAEIFNFLVHYRLLTPYPGDNSTLLIWKGVEASFDVMPHGIKIHQGRFYLKDSREDLPERLCEVFPFVVGHDNINDSYMQTVKDIRDDDLGVYESFSDEDLDSKIVYFMIKTNMLPDLSPTGPGKSIFLSMKDVHQQIKNRDMSPLLPLETSNLCAAAIRISDNQSLDAQKKYASDAYIQPKAFTALFDTFLFHASEPIMAVTGNVGVGKTNLLWRYYSEKLIGKTETVVFWFNGSNIESTRSLAWTICRDLRRDGLNIVKPQDDTAADILFADLIRHYLDDKKIVILVDGVNENKIDPLQLIEKILNFSAQYSRRVKTIITSRPQVWMHAINGAMGNHFKSYLCFSHVPDELRQHIIVHSHSFVLPKFNEDDLAEAYKKYCKKYEIFEPPLKQLRKSLREAIKEPLILRIVCETYKNTHAIPCNKDAEDIMGDLITIASSPHKPDDNTRSGTNTRIRLNSEDFEFLRDHLIPHFFRKDGTPKTAISRNDLKGISIHDKRGGMVDLDRLIWDSSLYSDGTAVNQRIQNLLDSGWIVIDGSRNDYAIRFRFEYFYDYFVGEYLKKEYEKKKECENSNDTTKAYFDSLIQHLFNAPFLWGPLYNLLILRVKDKGIAELEHFGYTVSNPQRELVISVVKHFYDISTAGVEEVLKKWLNAPPTIPENIQAAQIASQVAVEKNISNLIHIALLHENESVRQFASQNIYSLWASEDTQPTHAKTVAILSDLASNIRFRNIIRWRLVLYSFLGLMHSSLMINIKHYNRHRLDVKAMTEIQQVWAPVFDRARRLFLLVPRRFRLSAIRFIIRQAAVRIVDKMEPESSDTSAIIDAKEVRKFFPPRDDRRAVFDLLLPHLDAAATHIPIQELTPVLRRMILTERDYTTIIGLCLLVLVAHVYNDHIGTAEALLELTQILVAEYPKTEDPQKPTAPFWIYTIAWSLGNTPFTDIDREEALIVLSAYIKIVTLMETHFKSAVEASDDRVFRISLIGDSIIWSYELDLDIGRQALKNLIHIAIEEGDESQILRYCKHFPELMKYFALPRAALEVLYDCITILKDANYGNSMWWDKYWSEICKSLIKHGGEYKEHVESFIMRFDQGDIPDQIKNSLLSMSANEDISTEFAFAGLHLFRYAMKDPNPVMRDFIKEIGRLSLKHDKYENWLAECFLKVANIAYGDEFIPV